MESRRQRSDDSSLPVNREVASTDARALELKAQPSGKSQVDDGEAGHARSVLKPAIEAMGIAPW